MWGPECAVVAAVCVVVRGQFHGVSSLRPPLYRFWGLNLGQQACVANVFICIAISLTRHPGFLNLSSSAWVERRF